MLKEDENIIKIELSCDCYNKEHMVYLAQDNSSEVGSRDQDHGTCYIYTNMNHYLPWYKRVLVGMKYIFGIDNTFVHYTECVTKVSDLKSAIKKLK